MTNDLARTYFAHLQSSLHHYLLGGGVPTTTFRLTSYCQHLAPACLKLTLTGPITPVTCVGTFPDSSACSLVWLSLPNRRSPRALPCPRNQTTLSRTPALVGTKNQKKRARRERGQVHATFLSNATRRYATPLPYLTLIRPVKFRTLSCPGCLGLFLSCPVLSALT